MINNHQQHIVDSMRHIRNQGLAAANELNHEMSRLADWREHVRSNPLPILISAASLGYFLVPLRRPAGSHASVEAMSKPIAQAQSPENTVASTARSVSPVALASAAFIALRGQATKWLIQQATGFAKQYVAQQLQQFKEHRDDHSAPLSAHTPANKRSSYDEPRHRVLPHPLSTDSVQGIMTATFRSAEKFAQTRPGLSVIGAMAIGCAIGWLVKRSR